MKSHNMERKIQYTKEEDNRPMINANGMKRVQQIICKFQFYMIDVDKTMLVSSSSFTLLQTKSTKQSNYKLV